MSGVAAACAREIIAVRQHNTNSNGEMDLAVTPVVLWWVRYMVTNDDQEPLSPRGGRVSVQRKEGLREKIMRGADRPIEKVHVGVTKISLAGMIDRACKDLMGDAGTRACPYTLRMRGQRHIESFQRRRNTYSGLFAWNATTTPPYSPSLRHASFPTADCYCEKRQL